MIFEPGFQRDSGSVLGSSSLPSPSRILRCPRLENQAMRRAGDSRECVSQGWGTFIHP